MIMAAVRKFLAWLVSVCALGLSEVFGAFKTIQKLDLNFGFALFMAIFNGALFASFISTGHHLLMLKARVLRLPTTYKD